MAEIETPRDWSLSFHSPTTLDLSNELGGLPDWRPGVTAQKHLVLLPNLYKCYASTQKSKLLPSLSSVTMADSMSYSATNQYLSAQYYPPTHVGHNHVQHVMPTPPRQDIAPRKRPKYTRSKTGCMTCRVKKIKCDETKPNCMRCTHGQRECTWPEGVPARKKSTGRKDSIDGRPSTAGSSISESSNTPPTREPSPPRRQQQQIDLNLIPLTTQRRPNDAYLQLQPIQTDLRSMSNDRSQGYPQQHTHTPTSGLLSMMPEQAYQPRYDHYSSATQRNMQPYRSMTHASLAHWSPPSEQMDPYQYPTLQDRALVAHHTSASDSHRYQ